VPLSGHRNRAKTCPLSGVKLTLPHVAHQIDFTSTRPSTRAPRYRRRERPVRSRSRTSASNPAAAGDKSRSRSHMAPISLERVGLTSGRDTKFSNAGHRREQLAITAAPTPLLRRVSNVSGSAPRCSPRRNSSDRSFRDRITKKAMRAKGRKQ
jgi:hypothetical protein